LRSGLADNVSANVVGTILGTLFRFWAYRRWVFVDLDEPERAEDSAAAAVV
jgi:putative flippase GtrA